MAVISAWPSKKQSSRNEDRGLTYICVPVYGENERELIRRVETVLSRGADLVEIRLDLSQIDDVENLSDVLKPFAEKLVLTCRPVGEGGKSTLPAHERISMLAKLGRINPAYVDVELQTIKQTSVQNLKSMGCRFIVSWHDFTTTPESQILVSTAEECLKHGDIAKIVTFSSGDEDNYRVVSLYTVLPRKRLVAFCMGEKGCVTRILSMAAGSPIAYAAFEELQTALGQLSLDEMIRARELIVKGVSGD